MAARLGLHLRSHLLRSAVLFQSSLRRQPPVFAVIESPASTLSNARVIDYPFTASGLRFFSTGGRRRPVRSKNIDIGARARQIQNRRLWTYSLSIGSASALIVLVLYQFQDQMVFYVTPTDALEDYAKNPSKNKFRLGGLVLEGSVKQPVSSPDMEFVVTDLITDILVRYDGALPDLFREGHSVVVEGFVKPFTDEIRKDESARSVAGKARSMDCYFSAIEVLAKHDEKYMPQEVAAAIERNKKKLAEMAEEGETATSS
ncbi:hypothetical protein PVL29_009332 [Vitis rotundifolia]|uniref:Cytochrome c-type biogenesis protein CcmE n=1 Tax=Vitis rotundifolia TaxID=103349 RepID=A0AA38ZZ31_VITRO|nr:hypothetical protein PVL29_009332 [Vitis rotundifolia]